jgi:hypothetical protein
MFMVYSYMNCVTDLFIFKQAFVFLNNFVRLCTSMPKYVHVRKFIRKVRRGYLDRGVIRVFCKLFPALCLQWQHQASGSAITGSAWPVCVKAVGQTRALRVLSSEKSSLCGNCNFCTFYRNIRTGVAISRFKRNEEGIRKTKLVAVLWRRHRNTTRDWCLHISSFNSWFSDSTAVWWGYMSLCHGAYMKQWQAHEENGYCNTFDVTWTCEENQPITWTETNACNESTKIKNNKLQDEIVRLLISV